MTQQRVLSVGGNDILTHPLPAHYSRFKQETLDIDPDVGADLVCDAREMLRLPGGGYDAVYCSHNLEHYYAHDVPRVLAGFLHLLEPQGFAEIWVPDIPAVMAHAAAKGLCLEDTLYQAGCGPILVRDVIYGFGKEVERSGQDFYAHKTGFSRASLRAHVLKAGFAECVDIKRGYSFELGVLAFKQAPDATTRRRFPIDVVAA